MNVCRRGRHMKSPTQFNREFIELFRLVQLIEHPAIHVVWGPGWYSGRLRGRCGGRV